MFKKTKVRQLPELFHKDLSARDISKTLNVSRNSVAFMKESYDKCDKDWDEICLMNNDEIYQLFYPIPSGQETDLLQYTIRMSTAN